MPSFATQTVIVGSATTTTAANTTYYFPLGGKLMFTTTEAHHQIPIRVAGVFSGLAVRVTANGRASSTTFRVRKNGANGSQSVSFGVGVTGYAENTSNTDSCVAGDLFNFSLTTGLYASGTITPYMVALSFLASADTSKVMVLHGDNSAGETFGVVAHRWNGLNGLLTPDEGSESVAKLPNRVKCALRFLRVYVSSNSAAGANTLTLANHTVLSSLAVSIAAGVTGSVENVSDTFDADIGDNLALRMTVDFASFTVRTISLLQTSTTTDFTFAAQDVNPDLGTIAFGTTHYIPIDGSPERATTESNVQLKVRHTGLKLRELTVYINNNSLDGSSTFAVRKNGANATQTVSFASGVTGILTDSSNIDSTWATTDLTNYSVVNGGTTGSISLRTIAVNGYNINTAARTLTEAALTVSDALSRLKKAVRSMSEPTISVSDSITRARRRPRTAGAETVNVSDSITRRIRRSLAEAAVSVSDSIAITRRKNRTPAEPTIAVSDTLARRVRRTMTETVGVVDTLVRRVKRSISETVTVSDSLGRQKTRRPTLTEPQTNVSDSLARRVRRSMVEAVSVVDAITRKAVRAVTEPAVPVGDSLARSFRAVRSMGENVTGSDSLQRRVTRSVTETMVSNDSIAVLRKLTKALTETVTVGDSLSRLAGRSMAETVGTSDSLSRKTTRAMAETVSVGDSVESTKVSGETIAIAEDVDVAADSLSGRLTANRNVLDEIEVTDSLLASKRYAVVPTAENVGVSDGIAIRLLRRRSMSDSVVGDDTLNRRAYFFRTITETAISSNDSINTTRLLASEKHSYKLGRRFPVVRTNDARLEYTDAKDEFTDDRENFY